jgi:hypothetical protein
VASLEKGPLAEIGLATNDVVLAVGENRVTDGAAFSATLKAEVERLTPIVGGGAIALTVRTGDSPPREFKLKVEGAAPAPPPPPPHNDGSSSGSSNFGGGGVNIWDQTGGGNVHANDPKK